MGDKYDYLYKIVLIGDTDVGKTCILHQLTTNTFLGDTKPTIGVEFDAQTFTLPEATIKAQIWDTAGQERYRAIINAYYRGTMGAMIIYDVTNEKSLKNCLGYWLVQLKRHADASIVIVLAGNKNDLDSARKIAYEDGEDIAKKNGMIFFETSAKTGNNVKEAFELLLKTIHEKHRGIGKNEIKKSFDKSLLNGKDLAKKEKKNSGCC